MNNNADWLEGFDAGLAANAERVKELEADHISPKLLLEDLQERHEALMDNYPADENDPIVPYCDGQRYVLERLLSDVQAGLWKVKFE